MAAVAKQVGGRTLSYLLVRSSRPPAIYGSGRSTTNVMRSNPTCADIDDQERLDATLQRL